MKNNCRKIILGVLLLALGLGAGLPIAYRSYVFLTPPGATFTVRNQSDQMAETIEVTLCGQKKTSENLATLHTLTLRFRALHDCHYDASVQLETGTILTSSGGYVTNGANTDHVLLIRPGGISIRDAANRD